MVISQPGVKGASPTQAAIDAMKRVKGFEGIAPGAYYDSSEGLLIFDLLPRTAILTEDGDVFPIDPVIQRIDADFHPRCGAEDPVGCLLTSTRAGKTVIRHGCDHLQSFTGRGP